MAKTSIKAKLNSSIFARIKNHFYVPIIVAFSMLLRANLPGDGGLNAPNDDLLGVRLANNLIQGNWLGEWNINTLSKPPMYSFYLASIHFIPIPYKFINHGLFLLVALGFTIYISRLFEVKKNLKLIRFVSFSVLAFNPFIFQTGFNRVYRQSLTVTLIIAFFTSCVMILSSIDKLRFHEFQGGNIKAFRKVLVGSGSLGLLYGLMELTNATSYWILPISLSIILLGFRIIKCSRKTKLELISLAILTGILFYLIPTGLVKGINKFVYGSYRTENFYSGGFSKAINTWASVQNGSDSRTYIAISSGQRQAVYKISPLAKTLETHLENPAGTGWKSASCNSPIKTCDESANWFSWQLRDAAMASHNFSNEKEFQVFFNELALEISQACKKDLILCGNPGAGPGSKAFSELDEGLIWKYFKLNISYILNFEDGGTISTPDGYGAAPEIIKEWQQVVRYSPMQRIDSTLKPAKNRYFDTHQKVFKGLSYLLIFIILISLILRRQREKIYGINELLILIGGSGAGAALGLSIFDISMGWHLGGMYDLPIVTCFILLSISAMNYLVKYFEDFTSSISK